jgi:predicted GIY-YIG superfamily endonuclease
VNDGDRGDKLYMKYFVYILRTSSNTLYIGQTNNLEKRLKEHQSKSSKSAKYVRYFDSVELVYSEKYLSRKEAMQREVQLKKWTRKNKDALIQSGKFLIK